MKKSPVFLLLFFSLALYSENQDGAIPKTIPLVAINALISRSISSDEAATLTDVLRNALVATKVFEVMERGQMEEILKEQAFQASGSCNEDACIVEMGQLLGIQQIITGSIGKVGSAYSINVRIISVKTGKILRSVSHNYTGPIEGLLTSEMDVVARKLGGIETKFSDRTKIKRKDGRKAFLVIGVSAFVVGGAIAIIAIITDNKEQELEDDKTALEVTWE